MDFENEMNETSEINLKVRKTNSAMTVAGLFFLLIMILQLPLSFVMMAVYEVVPQEHQVLASILMTQGYMFVCVIIYIFATRQSLKADMLVRKYKISTFFLSIVLLVVASPMASWLNLLSQLFAKNEVSTSVYGMLQSIPMWLGILVVGCLPGVVEELAFRGVIYGAFRKRSVLTGVVVSALTFGLMHGNFNQIMYAVYLGVVFAFLVEATGSLVSTMILHLLFNGVNTSYMYILPKIYEFLGQYSAEYAAIDFDAMMNATPSKQEILLSMGVMTPLAIGGLVLAVLLLKVIAKINGRDLSWKHICGDKGEVKQTRPWNVPLILGCIFCIVVAVGNMF